MLFLLLTTLAIHVVVLGGKMACEVYLLPKFGTAFGTVVPLYPYVVFERSTAFRAFEKSVRVAFERPVVTWETNVVHFLTCVPSVFVTDSNTRRHVHK